MQHPKEKAFQDALAEAKALSERTNLTDEEQADLESRTEQVVRLQKAWFAQRDLDAMEAEKAPQADDHEPADDDGKLYFDNRIPGKSLGDIVMNSELGAWLKKSHGRGDSPSIEVHYKAEPTVIDQTTAVPSLVVAQRVNTIEGLASFPLSVADLIPSIQTNANSVSYFTETSETSSIAGVAEGAEKPNFTLAGALVSDEVEVIAGMTAVTRQTLEDVPFMQGFINSRLTYKLRQVEEDQILEGNGTSPNLDGITNRTTSTQAQGADTAIDAIYKAADKCLVSGGYPADALAIHPTDWQPIRLSTDGVDRYYGDGPFGQILGDTIWGLRVVKSPLLTAKTVVVGAFRQAAFLARNGGLTIRTSDSHSDYFKKNKVAVLIEERVALGVPAPLAFCELTLV